MTTQPVLTFLSFTWSFLGIPMPFATYFGRAMASYPGVETRINGEVGSFFRPRYCLIDIGMAVQTEPFAVIDGRVLPIPVQTRFIAVQHRKGGRRLAIVDRAGEPLDHWVIAHGDAAELGQVALKFARELTDEHLLVLYHHILSDLADSLKGLPTVQARKREARNRLAGSRNCFGEDLITFV